MMKNLLLYDPVHFSGYPLSPYLCTYLDTSLPKKELCNASESFCFTLNIIST